MALVPIPTVMVAATAAVAVRTAGMVKLMTMYPPYIVQPVAHTAVPVVVVGIPLPGV